MKNQEIDWQKVWTIVIPSTTSMIPSLGHFLLGAYKRGLIILSIWVGLIIAARFSPYEIGLVPLFIFWVWQWYDVAVRIRKKYPELPVSYTVDPRRIKTT